VHAIDYRVDEFSIDQIEDAVITIFKKMKKKDTVIFSGTSLGGFVSLCMSFQFGHRCVAINPALWPTKSLVKHLGKCTNYQTGEIFDFRSDHVDHFIEAENLLHERMSFLDDPTKITFLLAKNDNIIDPNITAKYLRQLGVMPKIIWSSDAGHQYNDVKEIARTIINVA
jgi:predicted esterase YcpF (UPF0227 family)